MRSCPWCGCPRRLRQVQSGQKHAVFAAFVGLGVLKALTQHSAKGVQSATGVAYNPLCPVVVVSLAKLGCSLAMYRLWDGTFSCFLQTLCEERAMVLRYSTVSGLFTAYDVLSFVNLGLFDPQTYLVLLQLRTVLTGAVWEVAFGRKLRGSQLWALALLSAACMGKQLGAGVDLEAATSRPGYAYVLLALQIVANCCAGVANEVLLKDTSASRGLVVSLNLQNAVQYAWTVLWCLAVGFALPLGFDWLPPFDLAQWATVLDPHMWPSVVVLAALGLVTAVFLKVFDSVAKCVSTALELFLVSFAAAAVFGYPVRWRDFVALCLMVFGVVLYGWPAGARSAPLRPKDLEV